jgi:hypothetical protein
LEWLGLDHDEDLDERGAHSHDATRRVASDGQE